MRREAAATDDECRAQAAKARAWFDYRVEGGPRAEHAVAELVCVNAALDYAIVRLQDGAVRCVVCEAPGRCRVCGSTDFGIRRGGEEVWLSVSEAV